MVTPAGHCGAGRGSLAGETWLWDGTLPWDTGCASGPGASGSLCRGLNKQAAGQDVAVCLAQQGGCSRWCYLGQGTRVTPWEVAGAGTHLPSSAGCSGEQGPTLAVCGCWEIQGARTWCAWLFHQCARKRLGTARPWRAAVTEPDPKVHPRFNCTSKAGALEKGCWALGFSHNGSLAAMGHLTVLEVWG